MRKCHVHLLPDLVEPSALAGAAVVVIDVLRATTTMVHALVAGAKQLILCGDIDEARQLRQGWHHGSALLGGERQGVKIPGFDLGNSPTEYTPESVGGATIFFTTTNGTRAMLRCVQAQLVVAGALVNRRAVVEKIAPFNNVHLVCAGTRGVISLEDTLLAGGIASALEAHGEWELNDEAVLARSYWQHILDEAGGTGGDQKDSFFSIWSELEESAGGRNLIAEGFRRDIMTSAWLDEFSIVPVFDTVSRSVTIG